MSNEPYPLLHNTSLNITERIQQALSWIREPDKCPVSDQGPASAKCYLLYRALDGLLTSEEEAEVLNAVIPTVKNRGLAARWAMSNATAEAYLLMSRAMDDDYRIAAIKKALKVWDTSTRKDWPPQILNFLRLSLILSYWQYLKGDKANAIRTIENAFLDWQAHMAMLDWKRWPHRVTEARDDLLCLQSMEFIARSLGELKFGDYDWCNPEMLWPIPHTTKCPMYVIARRLSLLYRPDGDGVIWQYRPTLGGKVAEYAKLHASQPYGKGGMSEPLRLRMAALVGDVNITSAVDYGCGRSNDAHNLWPSAEVVKYAPAIPEYIKFPRRRFDIGLCTEVMEHIPLEEIDNTLWEMRCLSHRWLCTIHTAPAAQLLSTGENAHCLQRPLHWWKERFERIFGKCVVTEELSAHRFILATKA